MSEKNEYKGFFATYEDGRDLRRYIPIATLEDKKTGGISFASEVAWQRWYLEPGWYRVTIEPWYPPGMEPLEEEE